MSASVQFVDGFTDDVGMVFDHSQHEAGDASLADVLDIDEVVGDLLASPLLLMSGQIGEGGATARTEVVAGGERRLAPGTAFEGDLVLGVSVGDAVVLEDLATTAVGLHVGAVETNPVGNAALLAAGFPALCALKSGAAGVAATGWCATPDWCHAAPATVGALWLSIAAWNAVIVGVIVA